MNIDEYLYYLQNSFNRVQFMLHDIKELINELDADYDIDHFIYTFGNSVSDFRYECEMHEIRLRALRDKLENG